MFFPSAVPMRKVSTSTLISCTIFCVIIFKVSTSTVDAALLGHFDQEQKHINNSAYKCRRLIRLKIYWVMNGDSYLSDAPIIGLAIGIGPMMRCLGSIGIGKFYR